VASSFAEGTLCLGSHSGFTSERESKLGVGRGPEEHRIGALILALLLERARLLNLFVGQFYL